MTEVVFVGTGPAIAPPGRGNISFLVSSGAHSMLFECGPVVLDGLRRANVSASAIDTLFISHRHGDHTLGFPMLILHRMIARDRGPLRVVAGRSLRPMLSALVNLVYAEAAGALADVQWLELDEDSDVPREVRLYPDVRLRYCRVCGPEDVPVLGMRVDCPDGSVAYSGDTARCTDVIARLARGCDLLIHESNFSARLQPEVDAGSYGHSTATQAAVTARAAGARALALVHLSSVYAGREPEVLQEARAAFDGLIVIPSDGDRLRIA